MRPEQFVELGDAGGDLAQRGPGPLVILGRGLRGGAQPGEGPFRVAELGREPARGWAAAAACFPRLAERGRPGLRLLSRPLARGPPTRRPGPRRPRTGRRAPPAGRGRCAARPGRRPARPRPGLAAACAARCRARACCAAAAALLRRLLGLPACLGAARRPRPARRRSAASSRPRSPAVAPGRRSVGRACAARRRPPRRRRSRARVAAARAVGSGKAASGPDSRPARSLASGVLPLRRWRAGPRRPCRRRCWPAGGGPRGGHRPVRFGQPRLGGVDLVGWQRGGERRDGLLAHRARLPRDQVRAQARDHVSAACLAPGPPAAQAAPARRRPARRRPPPARRLPAGPRARRSVMSARSGSQFAEVAGPGRAAPPVRAAARASRAAASPRSASSRACRRGGDRARRGRPPLVELRRRGGNRYRREPGVLGGQRGDPLGRGLGRTGRVVAVDARRVQRGRGGVHGRRRLGRPRAALRDVGRQPRDRGLVAGVLGAVRAGQFERRPLRAAGELVAGGAVGLLGRPLGGPQPGHAGLARRQVRVELAYPVGDAQRGQRRRLGAQPPQPLLGVRQLRRAGRRSAAGPPLPVRRGRPGRPRRRGRPAPPRGWRRRSRAVPRRRCWRAARPRLARWFAFTIISR